jgi:hypothetical protein
MRSPVAADDRANVAVWRRLDRQRLPYLTMGAFDNGCRAGLMPETGAL